LPEDDPEELKFVAIPVPVSVRVCQHKSGDLFVTVFVVLRAIPRIIYMVTDRMQAMKIVLVWCH
jgi:hypothetical protein